MWLERRPAQLDLAFRTYTPYRLLPFPGSRKTWADRAGTKGATAMIALAYMAYLVWKAPR